MASRVNAAGLVALICAVAFVGAPAQAAAARTTTITKTPKVQRTKGFNGYATYVFTAASGRRIVSASSRIVGGTARAVRISGHSLTRNATRYTVNLVFPGEQGTPGRLVVTLRTVAAQG